MLRGKRATSSARHKAVILIGFMGAGKSSVGRALSEQLGWIFEDLDERIERRERRKLAEIFRESGESGFRRAEHAALKEVLSEVRAGVERIIAGRVIAGKIVALGGGAFVQKRNARLIEAGGVPTVFLDGGAEELWQRCRQQADRQGVERPLLGSLESFRKLYEARRFHYLKASLKQETGGKTAEQIAAEVVQTLRLDRSRGRQGEKQ